MRRKINHHLTSNSSFTDTSEPYLLIFFFFNLWVFEMLKSIKYLILTIYRRIIEEDIAESQNENGALDVVSELAYKNHFKSVQTNIEKMAMLHMEFWSQLSEDNPGFFNFFIRIDKIFRLVKTT